MKNYHVTQRGDSRWSLKGEKATRAVGVFETQRAAIERGSQLRSDHSVKIHGCDGRIRDERTYPRNADPYPPRG